MIARAGQKKKILGREVKELFSVNQWDSEAHFRSFYCVFFFICMKFAGGGGVRGVGGSTNPLPSRIYAWIGKLLEKPLRVIIINVLLSLI